MMMATLPGFWATNPLPLVAVILGTFLMATRLPGVVAPGKFRAAALQFPRSVWVGRIVMLVVAVWAGYRMYGAATDEWAWARTPVVLGVPTAYVLIIFCAEQFLAVRATAALMLLVANVAVRAADLHESPWRLVVTVLAYVWVVAAIWMAAAPNHCRDALQWLMASDGRCRTVCGVGLGLGAVLVVLGTFVY
jgi:hypothetical protein